MIQTNPTVDFHVSERLLTPEEVAAMFRTSRVSVIRQSRSGKIPAIKLGKVWRFRKSTINRWLTEREAVVDAG
jgi:excisionase family DNA binding protein